jgi:hypothetical protein
MFRNDVWAVLSSAPAEAQGVLDALRAGTVDGTVYEGQCACLVGTIAKVRGCDVDTLEQDSSRPAEQWFMQILPGMTPETAPVVQQTAEWVEQWIANMRAAFAASAHSPEEGR